MFLDLLALRLVDLFQGWLNEFTLDVVDFNGEFVNLLIKLFT